MNKNLKPFDLEAALQGAAVTTKAGHEVVEVICCKSFKGNIVIAVINCVPRLFSEDGKYLDLGEFGFDLFMKPTQITKWVNIYKNSTGHHCGNHLHLTKEQALKNNEGAVDTIQITFED